MSHDRMIFGDQTTYKNQAGFAAPVVSSPAIFGSFKLNQASEQMMNMINQFNSHQQLAQQITKVQKSDPSLEHKLREQLNGNGFSCVTHQTGPSSNGFNYSSSISKTESDSNGSSNHSDGRNTINGGHNVSFSNHAFLNQNSPMDAGLLKNSDVAVCLDAGLLGGLSSAGQNSLANLSNFNVNYLNNGLFASNLINQNVINAKVPESSNKRMSSGRKPTNSKEAELSPEEETKRKQRRERNKEAAARCRKRRVEQTSKLEEETHDLQRKKEVLNKEIAFLKHQSDQLLGILHNHDCKLFLNAD